MNIVNIYVAFFWHIEFSEDAINEIYIVEISMVFHWKELAEEHLKLNKKVESVYIESPHVSTYFELNVILHNMLFCR